MNNPPGRWSNTRGRAQIGYFKTKPVLRPAKPENRAIPGHPIQDVDGGPPPLEVGYTTMTVNNSRPKSADPPGKGGVGEIIRPGYNTPDVHPRPDEWLRSFAEGAP